MSTLRAPRYRPIQEGVPTLGAEFREVCAGNLLGPLHEETRHRKAIGKDGSHCHGLDCPPGTPHARSSKNDGEQCTVVGEDKPLQLVT